MGLRFYVCTDEGLRRIAMKVIEERALLPQFAGTCQKIVEVVTQRRNGKLFFRAQGTYLDFDDRGQLQITMESMGRAFQLVQVSQSIENEGRKGSNVADMGLRRERKTLQQEVQWELSAEQKEAIAADLLGSERPEGTTSIPLLRAVPCPLKSNRTVQS
jgi:hypothetical protein